MKEVTIEAGNGGTAEHGRLVGSTGGSGGSGGGRSREEYGAYQVVQDKPARLEVIGSYLYEFCSYFIQTLLIPVVFPLIISQLQHLSSDTAPAFASWRSNHPQLTCSDKEIGLYVVSFF